MNDYNLVYFDIETLNDFITIIFNDNSNKFYKLILHEHNLDVAIKDLKKWLFNLNNIFIGWNTNYDATILMNLIYLYDNGFEKLIDSKNKKVLEIINHPNYSFNYKLLVYMKLLSDSIVYQNTYYDFEVEVENETLTNGIVNFYYKNQILPIFYDAMKEQLQLVGLKSYQSSSGIKIDEFKYGFENIYYQKNKDTVKWDILINELIKYNAYDVSSLKLLHKKNIGKLFSKLKLLESNNIPLHNLSKKDGGIINKVFEVKYKSNFHYIDNTKIPLNQYASFYDFIIHNDYGTDKIINTKIKTVIDNIKSQIIDTNNPYYEIINDIFNTNFEKITLLNEIKIKNKKWIDTDNKKQWVKLLKLEGNNSDYVNKVLVYSKVLNQSFYLAHLNNKYYISNELGNLEIIVANGGIHSSIKNLTTKDIYLIDLTSQYPSIMIEYDLYSRNLNDDSKQIYANLKTERVEIKNQMKNTNDPKLKYELELLSDSKKLVLNTKYGLLQAPFYNFYDPDQQKKVCYMGQILLLYLSYLIYDLNINVIQHNTDGIMVVGVNEKNKDLLKERLEIFKQTTLMDLTQDFYSHLIQKDVNNYIAYNDENKEFHNKGAAFKDASIDYNNSSTYLNTKPGFNLKYPIISKMVVNKLLFNTDFQETINNNPQIINYLTTKKTSSANQYVAIKNPNEEIKLQPYKIYRFLNTNSGDCYYFYKNKQTLNKIADVSNQVVNVIEDVQNKTINDYDVNFEFYLQMAQLVYLEVSNQITKKEKSKLKLQQQKQNLDLYAKLFED